MPRTSPAKPQLDALTQDLKFCKTEAEAIKRFSAFTEHIFVNHKLYEPDNHRKRTWTGWVKTAKKIIKVQFPEIEFPKVWFNCAEVFNAETDEAMSQALKEACKAQNSSMYRYIWGSDEPEPKPKAQTSPIDEAMSHEDVQAAMKRTGLEREPFIIEAIHAYAKAHQGNADALSKVPTQELASGFSAGYSEHFCERAARFMMLWNTSQKDEGQRYQITFTLLKTLTGCGTATIEQLLGNQKKGVQGTMKDEIDAHHESLGMVSKVYNRGKQNIEDLLPSEETEILRGKHKGQKTTRVKWWEHPIAIENNLA